MSGTKKYDAALAWARGLHVQGAPLDFPEPAEYAQLAAEKADIDVADYDPDVNRFHDLPEEYELAYLTVRLERLKEKIRREKGLEIGRS